MEKKNLIKLYNLPNEIKFCKKCTISNQRPRITFDHKGICSACNFTNHTKKKLDWTKRERDLKTLCDRFRSKNGSYDVVVPCSGGKDGTFVAHQLKNNYGMNPICVTWSPLLKTEIGSENLDEFIKSGFSHIMGTPNYQALRKITKLAFKEIGDPFQPFIYGQSNFPLFIAKCYDIKLIMYGENGEVEYGGDLKNANTPTRSIKDYNKHYFSNIAPEKWLDYEITPKEIYPFLAPEENYLKSSNIEMHFMGYYKFWDPQENFYYAKKYCNFKVSPERTEGTYSKYASIDDKLDGFHYYLSYIKFGIGRATSDTAHEIRDGKINRDEGKALVEKFDGEFPKKYFKTLLEFCDITEKEFSEIIDSWRSDHIWINRNGEWRLKKSIWNE